MKKGFTLIELLIVIVLLGIATASSIIVFNNIDKDTKSQDKSNIYKQIQRAAYIYMELNDETYRSFASEGEVLLSYDYIIKDSNYVTVDLEDYDDDNNTNTNYFIKIYIAKDNENKEYLNSCILDLKNNANGTEDWKCIANSEGNFGNNIVCCP